MAPDIEAIYAVLVGDCKMSFDQIARLTDRQVHDIVFRERDEKGQVIMRERGGAGGVPQGAIDCEALGELPETPENELMTALLLASAIGADPEKVRARWEAKHGRSSREVEAG